MSLALKTRTKSLTTQILTTNRRVLIKSAGSSKHENRLADDFSEQNERSHEALQAVASHRLKPEEREVHYPPVQPSN